jgi:hypothetical protein
LICRRKHWPVKTHVPAYIYIFVANIFAMFPRSLETL